MSNEIRIIDLGFVKVKCELIAGLYTATVLSGNSGMGTATGGVYKSLDDYAASIEKEHRYCYDFFYVRKHPTTLEK